MSCSEAFVGSPDHVEVQLNCGLGWNLGDNIKGVDDNDEIIFSGVLDIMEISRDAQ